MKIVTSCLRAEQEFSALCETLAAEWKAKKPLPLLLNGASGGAGASMLTEVCRESLKEGHPVVVFLPDDASARRLTATRCAAGLPALTLPTRDFVLHAISASHDRDRERLFVLHAFATGACRLLVTTPGAALAYTMPRARLLSLSLSLQRGSVMSPSLLAERLVALGYARVDTIESEGQFARRGGILDIFPPGENAPLRLEFFGDEIDDIRYFDLLTGRRTEEEAKPTLLPAREVLCDEGGRATLLAHIEKMKEKAEGDAAKRLLAEQSAIEGGLSLPFLDKYIALLYPEKENLLSYLSAEEVRQTILLSGTTAVRESLRATLSLSAESVLPLLESGLLSPAIASYYGKEADFDAMLEGAAVLHQNAFSGATDIRAAAGLFGLRCRGGVSYYDRYDLLTEDCRHLLDSGYRILLLTGNTAEEEALSARLREGGFAVAHAAPDEDFPTPARRKGVLYTTVLHPEITLPGFELPLSHLAVLSLLPDEAHVRRTKKSLSARKRKQAAGERLLSYAELKEGDLVVHAVHGIGRFEGMTTMQVDGLFRDYVTIRYAGTDKLFLPADRLEMITKYIGAGADTGAVKLSRLGGAEWQKATSRAKSAARDMAKELIQLYAARARRPGHAFPPDDALQRDFEAAFAYEETESQLQASEDIKRDMEKPTPMDRLLCGDVGYGKTEVALRAAFKAICDGKQVALLVPTTILALQHYETAVARMRSFPVTVEMLSRFRTPKQAAAIMRRVSRGEVDLLIGTHRLLSKDLTFKDLGLLIIDEEQRFGVAQKEKLRERYGNIDTLTLTATPIPRTLNMAMSGVRDMSLLDEAPGDRLPVQTYVLEHDELMIGEAVRRELRRGGQVIYLYNRRETMESTLLHLSRALPEARIVAAHGKMDKDELEEIWRALVRGEIDVILCTTIVETGVDLPNANTLIIEEADRMGLSQLHQLRGRVGRAGRQAYAYFTYRPGRVLSDIATRRLSAIREYAAFGAGFGIALRDLEIRGAGNILGAEQHGHIEAVGYDLYVRLLNEAVLAEQGVVAEPKKADAQVELRVPAFIPASYVESEGGRMALYKKISGIETEADRQDILEECRDRYGRLPPEVARLLSVALTRALACHIGITKVEQTGADLVFSLKEVNLSNWSVLFAERKNLKFSKTAPPRILYRLGTGEDPAAAAAAFLTRYTEVEKENL